MDGFAPSKPPASEVHGDVPGDDKVVKHPDVDQVSACPRACVGSSWRDMPRRAPFRLARLVLVVDNVLVDPLGDRKTSDHPSPSRN